MKQEHISVLLNESIEGLDIKPNGIYVDGTMGRAGHSKEILKRLENGKLYAFDKDQDALDRVDISDDKFEMIKADFRNIKNELSLRGIEKVDGILLDIGVSSPQFDEKERGFSYRFDDVLDMRMDKSQKLHAYIIVNKYSEEDLTQIFYEYGEEKYAKSIAKNIVKRREEDPIRTTFDLVDVIKYSLPNKVLNKKGHPAKKVFQALRIEVNDELGALKQVIEDGATLLDDEGRMAIITFHSLEDRIVKTMIKDMCEGEKIDPRIPVLPHQIKESDYELVSRKPIIASEEELEYNKRARSAKLRIIKRG